MEPDFFLQNLLVKIGEMVILCGLGAELLQSFGFYLAYPAFMSLKVLRFVATTDYLETNVQVKLGLALNYVLVRQ